MLFRNATEYHIDAVKFFWFQGLLHYSWKPFGNGGIAANRMYPGIYIFSIKFIFTKLFVILITIYFFLSTRTLL